MMNCRVLSFLLVVLAAGCGPGKLAPPDYVRWLEQPENGFRQTQKVGAVDVRVQYKPAAYIIANEERSQQLATDKVAARQKELGDLYYFTCTLQSGDGSDVLLSNLPDQQAYYQRVNYLSLDAQHDFGLVQGADTLPCILYQLENTYGATPYVNVLLAFSGKNRATASAMKLIYHDRIFSNRILEFPFNEKQLNNLPDLLTH